MYLLTNVHWQLSTSSLKSPLAPISIMRSHIANESLDLDDMRYWFQSDSSSDCSYGRTQLKHTPMVPHEMKNFAKWMKSNYTKPDNVACQRHGTLLKKVGTSVCSVHIAICLKPLIAMTAIQVAFQWKTSMACKRSLLLKQQPSAISRLSMDLTSLWHFCSITSFNYIHDVFRQLRKKWHPQLINSYHRIFFVKANSLQKSTSALKKYGNDRTERLQ